MAFDFRLKPIFAPAASKNTTHFKSGPSDKKNYYFASFSKIKSKFLIHTI